MEEQITGHPVTRQAKTMEGGRRDLLTQLGPQAIPLSSMLLADESKTQANPEQDHVARGSPVGSCSVGWSAAGLFSIIIDAWGSHAQPYHPPRVWIFFVYILPDAHSKLPT